ncbi:hypothetical protein SK128_021939 [Halocaridina rubra]|uniref:Uncharacterized protein n=1 Tax=Halocaridina rubra TaxID=373956 RepID=A0AAN8XEY5_HALRR
MSEYETGSYGIEPAHGAAQDVRHHITASCALGEDFTTVYDSKVLCNICLKSGQDFMLAIYNRRCSILDNANAEDKSSLDIVYTDDSQGGGGAGSNKFYS